MSELRPNAGRLIAFVCAVFLFSALLVPAILRAGETNVMSAVVTYLYVNSMADDGSTVASPVIAYQYQDALDEGVSLVMSPLVSYQFKIFDWAPGHLPPTLQPAYSVCLPTKAPDKDSLIVVTHGWNPDVTWLRAMTNRITQTLQSHRLANWQVVGLEWVANAENPIPIIGTEFALNNGEKEGVNLGKCIAAQKWKHVHLIAHSAGAALIQAALDIIKANASSTTVHETFLDAYVGVLYGGRAKYGNGADWADSYFTRDLETSGEIITGTEGALDHTYNVDITWLDPKGLIPINAFSSVLHDAFEPSKCTQLFSSHDWPHEFYYKTIPPSAVDGSEGFGFPLSKEGGNWDYATNHYHVANPSPYILGNSSVTCVPKASTPTYSGPEITLSQFELLRSQSGASVDLAKLTLTVNDIIPPQFREAKDLESSTTPAWAVFSLAVTDKINFVSFDAQYLSDTGAEGVLSVYWNTNIIGSIDERVVLPGLRRYCFPLLGTVTSNICALGFRLDAFTTSVSSIIVTNVNMSFGGLRDMFSLKMTRAVTNGLPIMQLIGPAGYNYYVEASTNLANWEPIALLVNTNGSVRFVDPQSTNMPQRFYRGVGP